MLFFPIHTQPKKLFNDKWDIFIREVYLTSPTTKIILRILRIHLHHCSMVLEYSSFLMTSLV